MHRTRNIHWSRYGRNTYTAYLLMNGVPVYVAVNVRSRTVGMRLDVPLPDDMPLRNGITLKDGTVCMYRKCRDLNTHSVLTTVYNTLQATGLFGAQAIA